MQETAIQDELGSLDGAEEQALGGELPDLPSSGLGLGEEDPGLGDPAGGLPDLDPSPPPSSGTLDKAIEELENLAPDAMAKTRASRNAPSDGASEMIWDIPIEVHIVIGSAELTVAELMALEGGEIIALDRHVGEPVDVTVNGRRIARGEITVMEQDETRFGIKITEIVSR